MWQFFLTFGDSLSFFFLTFDGFILTLCDSNITYDSSFVTLGGFLIFFFILDGSLLTLCSSNITCDSFFSHIWWFSYFFFFTFDGSILILCSSIIKCVSFFSLLVVPLLFFLTFDGFILTLCNSNITCDSFFSHLVVPLLFFSHLMISFSYCAVLTSHMTLFLSHSVAPYFFILKFNRSIITLGSTNITSYCTFVTFDGTLFFFLTIDNSIVIVSTINITFEHNFTFGFIIEVTFLLTNNRSSQ